MWMLSFVPDAILHLAVYAVMLAGVGLYIASFFLNLLPPAIPYREPVRILGTLIAVAGVYFYGGYSTEMAWRDKVSQLETKVAQSEAESKEANTKIKTVYVDRVKVIKDKQIVIEKQIVEVAAKMDAKCEVIPEALDILNNAAKGVKK
jgi:hypothetical protein